MKAASLTYTHLGGFCDLNVDGVKSVPYSIAGGKKRYGRVERVDRDTITVSIYGVKIIESTRTTLTLWTQGHRTLSTTDAFRQFLCGVKVNSVNGRYQVKLYGQHGEVIRDFTEGMVITDKAPHPTHLVPAIQLREGDLVDLERDEEFLRSLHATDCEDCEAMRFNVEYELQEVAQIVTTPNAVTVHFDNMALAVPHDHEFDVHQRGPETQVRAHMKSAPEVEVETPFGTVWLRADHDRITVNVNSNGRYITVNKVDVGFITHLYPQDDGTWNRRHPHDSNRVGILDITKRAWTNASAMHASASVHKKVDAVLPGVVKEWAESPIGQHWLAYAKEAHLNNAAAVLEEQIADTEATVTRLRARLSELLSTDVAEMESSLR